MSWKSEWQLLASRINGLAEATALLMPALRFPSPDGYGNFKKVLVPQIASIFEEIRLLRARHAEGLPQPVKDAMDRLLGKALFNVDDSTFGNNLPAVASFVAFRAEVDFLASDAELEKRALTELAFEHLRRSLVVDDNLRKRWVDADNEPACEKLGAVHLLSHGIWAFKISGAGAATDLVYGEPIETYSAEIRRGARALVLTEWKRVRAGETAEKKAEEARAQTGIYAAGVLGDVQLKDTRFIVLVTDTEIAAPSDVEQAGVRYRHVSIPLSSEVASKTARGKRSS
jgi:hypothetical protein